MQKLITVSIDTKKLVNSPVNPFNINEVDSINELLELGWEIEEWDILKEGANDGEILLLVILNDNAMFGEDDEFDDEFADEFGFGDDMDDDEQDDLEEERKV